MKKVKIFLKKLKKGDLDKPMISWGKLALKSLVCVHIIDNIVVIGLLYNNDDKILLGLFYLLLTNIIVYKCLRRLEVI